MLFFIHYKAAHCPTKALLDAVFEGADHTQLATLHKCVLVAVAQCCCASSSTLSLLFKQRTVNRLWAASSAMRFHLHLMHLLNMSIWLIASLTCTYVCACVLYVYVQQVHMHNEDIEAAKADLRTSLDINPNHIAAYNRLINIHQQEGNDCS